LSIDKIKLSAFASDFWLDGGSGVTRRRAIMQVEKFA
jgi:hypothetical protein